MARMEVIAVLKAHLRTALVGTTHHGERDEIYGAKITEASIQETADALMKLNQPRQNIRDELDPERKQQADKIERLHDVLKEIVRVGMWTGSDGIVYTTHECRIARAALTSVEPR